MTAKEYLKQAKHLDTKINTKLEHISSLHEMARKSPMAWSLKYLKEDVEKFFLSDWFKGLTDLDGKQLLIMLREEAEK